MFSGRSLHSAEASELSLAKAHWRFYATSGCAPRISARSSGWSALPPLPGDALLNFPRFPVLALDPGFSFTHQLMS